MYLFSVYIYLQLIRIKDKRKLIQNHLEFFHGIRAKEMMEGPTLTEKGDDGGSNSDRKMLTSYALTSNDNLGNIITQVQLKGENYDEWARVVRIALRAKKKYGFVDGSIKQSDNDSPELEDWWTINSVLVSWVFNTIEPTLQSTISYMENVTKTKV